MLKRLKSKSGASLIFVLAAMMLLLAIGGSAMTAASVSHGTVLEKRALNQLNLLADSVQRTVGSLLTGTITPAEVNDSGTLVGMIVDEIQKAIDTRLTDGSLNPGRGVTVTVPSLTFSMGATLSIPGLPENLGSNPVNLIIDVNCNSASYTPYKGEEWTRVSNSDSGTLVFEDTLYNPEIKQSIVISGCEVTVRYTAQHNGDSLVTAATYQLPTISKSGRLAADAHGDQFLNPNTGEPVSDNFIEVIYSLDEFTGEIDGGIFGRNTYPSDIPWNEQPTVTGEGRAVSYAKG